MRGFAGTGELVRLALRRDRLPLAAWVLITAALPAGLASATARAYPTAAERAAFAEQAAVNAAELATRGPVFAPTVGGLTAWTIGSSGVLLGGVVSLLLVIRHTRVEEQAGRRELTGAGVLGRPAPLAAALAVVTGANLLIALLAAAGLVASGLPPAGSVALGLALAAGGMAFAAVAALAAQMAAGSGAARGLALGVLGGCFALAAAGEVSRSGLVWLSPLGWARRVRAFAGEQWWVFGLFAVLVLALLAVAFGLAARRDLGAGLLAPRLGRAEAAGWRRTPVALAWLLHRDSLAAWTAGLLVLGTLLGAAMRSLGGQLDTPAFRAFSESLGGGDPAQVFFRFLLYVLAQVVAAAALVGALRARGQEVDGLADLLLAGPVGRVRWAAGHLVVTAAGAVVMLAGLGLGAGLGYGTPLAVLPMTLAYLPACLVFAGLATALVGWAPAISVPAVWTVLGLAVAVDLLGEFRLVPAEVLAVSPFVRTLGPLATGTGLAGELLGLTFLVTALAAFGLAGLRRRDLR